MQKTFPADGTTSALGEDGNAIIGDGDGIRNGDRADRAREVDGVEGTGAPARIGIHVGSQHDLYPVPAPNEHGESKAEGGDSCHLLPHPSLRRRR